MKYECSICKKVFDRKNNYVRHLHRKNKCLKITQKNNQNSSKNGKLYLSINECKYCHRIFTRKYSLKKHLNGRCKLKKDDEEIEKLKERIEKLEKDNKDYKQILDSMKKIYVYMSLMNDWINDKYFSMSNY